MSKHTAPATLSGTYYDLGQGIVENFTYADRKGKYRAADHGVIVVECGTK